MKVPFRQSAKEILFSQASFWAPLRDKGNGEVDLNLARGSGSATFTRATAASCRMALSEKYLYLPGTSDNYASTPDSAAQDITGDIDIRAKVELNDWTPALTNAIVWKFVGGSSANAYAMEISGSGVLRIQWAEDATNLNLKNANSTVGTGLANGAVKWIRATLDVNNGASGHDAKFYLSDDGVVWTQLGTTVTQAGVTTINAGTRPLAIGMQSNGVDFPMAGKVYYAEVRNGIDGLIVAQFDPNLASDGDTSFVSNTGETWTINQSGTNTAYLYGLLLKNVTSGTPRSHYLSDGTYAGYLAEGARTNPVLSSEDMRSAAAGNPVTAWINTDTTVTVAGTSAPDGTNTGNLCTEGTAGTAVVAQNFTSTADVIQTATIFMKRGNHDWILVQFGRDTLANRVNAWFNLATGAVGTVSTAGVATSGSASIEDWGSGWYRVRASVNENGGSTALRVQAFSASADNSTTRVNNATHYLWGAQVEVGTFPSSYIPTTTAAVTRNADVLTYTFAGNANGTAGTLYCEMSLMASNSDGHAGVTLDDGTANEVIYLGAVSTTRLVVFDGGVQQANISGTNYSVNTIFKEAARYGVNDFAISKDGGAVTTDTSGTMPTVNAIGIGSYSNGNNPIYGTLKNVRIWQTALSDSVLQTITV